MNFLDIIILLPIAYFAYKGFNRGFIKEIFGIVGIVLAVYITFEYMGTISGILAPYVENRDHSTIITGIISFVLIVAAVQITGFALERFIDVVQLGILNKIGGMIFAGLKTAILISGTLLLLAGLGVPSEESASKSVSYPVVIYVAPAAFNVVATLVPGTENFIQTIERTIQENNTLRELPIFENSDT
ncbi:MAG: CvpA family protein [Balneolaceae bacterium]|nr:CvpA family protein [Balneolaceae bacterium]MDR9407268.1 CvpA family protein [Balneolaceae bacterium]